MRIALKQQGLKDSAIETELARFESSVVHDGIQMQDAINFATYFLADKRLRARYGRVSRNESPRAVRRTQDRV